MADPNVTVVPGWLFDWLAEDDEHDDDLYEYCQRKMAEDSEWAAAYRTDIEDYFAKHPPIPQAERIERLRRLMNSVETWNLPARIQVSEKRRDATTPRHKRSKAPETCVYCDGEGNSSAGGACGFCDGGKPLDTQEDWDNSWGRILTGDWND